MVKISRTSDTTYQHLKVLTYGGAGVGKTTLCATAKDCIIISAESGLLSLRGHDLPVIEVTSLAEVQEAYRFLTESDEAKGFRWVCIDSLSEIAEVVLAQEKKASKDPRRAYGELQDRMAQLIRAFRDLPRHVYMSAKAERLQDENGAMLWNPSMPGQKLGQSLPYYFDEVFALRTKQVEDEVRRALQTGSDGVWTAKDRSGALAQFEEPNLETILNKIIS
jgi:phage nucleotide-binding protein